MWGDESGETFCENCQKASTDYTHGSVKLDIGITWKLLYLGNRAGCFTCLHCNLFIINRQTKKQPGPCLLSIVTLLILTLILLMWSIEWAPNSISIHIQQDATLHSLFISWNCSTCFGWYLHPSSGAHTTVSTAFCICHTVTAICRYRGRVGTGLSVLWVAYATHSTLRPVPTDSGR
jgi:hypothetical protein